MYVYICVYNGDHSRCAVSPRRKETAQKQHSLRLLTYNNWKGYARLLMQGPFQSKTTQTLYLLICVSLFGMRAAYALSATKFIRVLWRARLGRVRERHQEPLQRGAAHRAVLSSLENAAEDAQDYEDLAPPRSHSPSYIHTHCTTKHRFTTT